MRKTIEEKGKSYRRQTRGNPRSQEKGKRDIGTADLNIEHARNITKRKIIEREREHMLRA